MSINLSVTDANEVSLSIADAEVVSLDAGDTTVVMGDAYTGSYEWTPSAEVQTVQINGLQATADITINAIPSNYGLITWDGSALTVS